MQAVILAAGLGTRMKSLTKDTPKPLLKIGERNLLEHKLHHLPESVTEIVIVVGYLGDQIRETLGEKFNGKPIRYVEQVELKGTGHALQLCRPHLGDKFMVLMGDDLYSKEDLAELTNYPLAILAWSLPSPIPDKKMAHLVRNEDGKLVDILEKQDTLPDMLVNTGAYMLSPRIFDYPMVPAEPGSTEFGLPQTIAEMARKGEEIHIVLASWWKNVTSPEDLAL